jgi:endonuclease/exonuclease/phosphatase (EEP) superfamily protein YafD
MPRLDIMEKLSTTVWIELASDPPRPRMLVGAVYRVWSDIATERANISALIDQLEMANVTKGDCLLLGDLNLDVARFNDINYNRRPLLHTWTEGYRSAGFSLSHTAATWRSHGLFSDSANPMAPKSHRYSTLDHVYTAGKIAAVATVVNNRTTDHRPVMACLD